MKFKQRKSYVLLAITLCTGIAYSQQDEPLSDPSCKFKTKVAEDIGDLTPEDALDPTMEEMATSIDWFKWNRMTGDWGGARTALEEMGIVLYVDSAVAYMQNFKGGVNTHNACDFGGDLRYVIEADFEQMGLVPGASFYIRARSTRHDGVRENTGAFRTHSNVTSCGDEEIYVEKWFFRQKLADNQFEFRVGRIKTHYDLFDLNLYADNGLCSFMNTMLVKNPTVPHGCSLGAYFKWQPCNWFNFRMAGLDQYSKNTRTGFDTTFHGPARFKGFWEFQITPQVPSDNGDLSGHYRFGLWYTGEPKLIHMDYLDNHLAPRHKTNDVGFYASFDQVVYKENDNPKDHQGLGLFLRYGWADGYVNLIENFWSIGATYEGLIPTRDADKIGFGVAQSLISRQYREQVEDRFSAETVYELYYLWRIAPWFDITPDIQWIQHPSGNQEVDNALVGGVRFTFRF